MKLRYALITQAPSLALQRAAHAEICRLDQHAAALAASLQTVLTASRSSDPVWSGAAKAAQEALAAYRAGQQP